jgi:pimeloyl-ACP methyl ester carboxylesterase
MNPNEPASTGQASYLVRPDGRIGYDVAGTGPLIVLVPGMGDLRAGYRFLAPALRAAGYRVACTDLRGHGDSDARFPSYGDEETAGTTPSRSGPASPAPRCCVSWPRCPARPDPGPTRGNGNERNRPDPLDRPAPARNPAA